MKYYTIENISKEIGKLNFVIINVDLALKVTSVVDIKLFFYGLILL